VVVGLVTCKPDRPRRRVSGEGCVVIVLVVGR
jgi:hypothetical protein